MEIGADSFAAIVPTAQATSKRPVNLLEEVEIADRAGLYAFGVSGHRHLGLPGFSDRR